MVRLAEPTTIDWYRETGKGDWYPDWNRLAATDFGEPDEVLEGWLLACLSAEPVETPGVPETSSVLREGRLDALTWEWFTDPLILVMATGSDDRPVWASALAFCTGHAKPSANDEVELFEDLRPGRPDRARRVCRDRSDAFRSDR